MKFREVLVEFREVLGGVWENLVEFGGVCRSFEKCWGSLVEFG